LENSLFEQPPKTTNLEHNSFERNIFGSFIENYSGHSGVLFFATASIQTGRLRPSSDTNRFNEFSF
jgi:hypothetical protein